MKREVNHRKTLREIEFQDVISVNEISINNYKRGNSTELRSACVEKHSIAKHSLLQPAPSTQSDFPAFIIKYSFVCLLVPFIKFSFRLCLRVIHRQVHTHVCTL